jgi:putative peptide zinc metalloprotease protein
MGAGLYLVWPAFYTDVTDSYRLGRAGRLRTDLGGLYFNALVVVGTFVWWWATGWEALLLLVATQVLQMMQQLLPLLRFDGYHVLADLAGVPDLYQRIRPTLLGLLPHRWNAPENKVLTPWARATITLWVLVTVPMLAMMLWGLVAVVPRIVGTAEWAIRADAASAARAQRTGDYLDAAAYGLEVLGVVLTVLGCALVLGRVGFRFFRGLARWSQASAPRRVVAAVLGTMLVTALIWAWWPHPGTYRPIGPDERGTIFAVLDEPGQPVDALARPPATSASQEVPSVGTVAGSLLSDAPPLVAAFQKDTALPTREDPVPAMVLVPTEPADTNSDGDPDDIWVFPFDKPLPPEEGDNQALAVATTDGSVTYDIAFALVWADGDAVLNVNEAHAYASCSDCVAVAVAFQVVLILDDAQVVVPQNLAVSANYECYRCITAAIASQLALSVPGEPGEEELRALGHVWSQLTQFAHALASYSLAEIRAQLVAFEAEIVAILGQAPTVEPEQSPSTASTTPSDDGSDLLPPTTSTTPSPTQETTSPAPSELTSPAPSDSTSPAPSDSTSPAPSESTSPTPSVTEAPSPTGSP